MTTIEHPEPNTTVAKLSLSMENTKHVREIETLLEHWCTEKDLRPSGATIIKGRGLWFPTDSGELDEEKAEKEDSLIIEIWIDSAEELEHVRSLKKDLEERYDQHCVCLALEDRYYEH